MKTPTAQANGQAPYFVIQALTKKGKTWKDVSDAGTHREVKISSAESHLGRKFPQRIAVRVIESTTGRIVFQRVKAGCEVPVILAGVREDVVAQYKAEAGSHE